MPKMFGPENRFVLQVANLETNTFEPLYGEPLIVEATTLGDAIQAYEQEFGLSITPYDGTLPRAAFAHGEAPKYFFYTKADSTQLVDIHIQRGDEEICPKQDLSFILLEDDVLHIGSLVC